LSLMGKRKRHSHREEESGRQAFFIVFKSLQGPFKGKKFEIPEWKPVQFKRSETSLTPSFHKRLGEVCLPDPDVSRLHAKVSFKGGRFGIVDLGSLNGTFLNDKRLSAERVPLDEPVVLSNGDKIVIGQSVFQVSIYKRFATLSEELEYEQGQDSGKEKRRVSKEQRAGTVPKRHIRIADLPVSQREALEKRLAKEEEEEESAGGRERNVFVDGLLPNKDTISRTILSVLAYNRRLDDVQNAYDEHSDSSSEEEEEEEEKNSSISVSDTSFSNEDSSCGEENDEDSSWARIRRTAENRLNSYIEFTDAYRNNREQASRLRLKQGNVEYAKDETVQGP
jgi:hypothetical protein